jgi:hypothetical protein
MSVFLLLTDYDYPFGIFKLFLAMTCTSVNFVCAVKPLYMVYTLLTLLTAVKLLYMVYTLLLTLLTAVKHLYLVYTLLTLLTAVTFLLLRMLPTHKHIHLSSSAPVMQKQSNSN